MLISPCVAEVARVAVVVPYAPADAFTPVARPNPPPFPLLVKLSTCSVRLARLAFVQPDTCAVVVSVPFATMVTTSVFVTVVVLPGIDTEVLAVAATPPAITSHGLPDEIHPRN